MAAISAERLGEALDAIEEQVLEARQLLERAAWKAKRRVPRKARKLGRRAKQRAKSSTGALRLGTVLKGAVWLALAAVAVYGARRAAGLRERPGSGFE